MSAPIGSFPCRFCGTQVRHSLVDLGMSPLCESYVAAADYAKMEPFYPLHAFVCHNCFLAQVDEFVPAEHIFSEYAYFSSFADSWVAHARQYCHDMQARFGLGAQSQVVEVGSNDGYLLQHFVEMGVPCYGIEPAANVAQTATGKGVPTEVAFFGADTARRLAGAGRGADLILGKNVMAQVPDLNDFVAGLKIMMRPGAVMTIEFPHLLATMEGNQFDQVYHEHYCYFSLTAAKRIFAHHGITLFDVEELPTHGGSLRVFGCRSEDEGRPATARLRAFEERETAAGLGRIETYAAFAEQVRETKRAALAFLIEANRAGKQVAAYGAPGKGNTFLNYCGIKTDLIAYTVDRNPYKQGRFLPGSRIPVFAPEKIAETRPDVIVVLPWNFFGEISQQLSYTADWGAEIVRFVPEVETLNARLPKRA
ncbi:class I SAM-dependent methyltransferase [Leisingera aquaemixtae]|uniref:class I SAM-dependent methyltransferase n=1 Tax=Leisingera aquaemixtae TaxID=1396826 RepID=UPI001C97DD68|nr:class I SAM-dependent methyltransferase [Leisingera aquaemixtae]MBY6069106.1 class I SAM-dependent methyltransferase [Leisingera aquaemixtae]